MQNKYIIGIDGGASKTTGILFDTKGNTIKCKSALGTNLSVNEEISAQRVINLINEIIDESKPINDDLNKKLDLIIANQNEILKLLKNN